VRYEDKKTGKSPASAHGKKEFSSYQKKRGGMTSRKKGEERELCSVGGEGDRLGKRGHLSVWNQSKEKT